MIEMNNYISDDAESIPTMTFSPQPPITAPKMSRKALNCMQRRQGRAITILLDVKTWEGDSRQSMQIKMRRHMSFGQLVSMLKSRFEKTDDFNLRMAITKRSLHEEWRMIFDSDTPSSLHLTDRAKPEFVRQVGVEVLDVSVTQADTMHS